MQMSDLEMAGTLEEHGVKPMLSEWMTRAELAAELDLTAETLCRWDARRFGPAPTRIGRKVLYRRDTVRAWLIAQEQGCNSTSGRVAPKTRGRR
jgi:hypothetical protein